MFAVYKKKPEFAERLIAAGANPNISSSEGMTAGVLAVEFRDDSILEMLLKAGAEVTTKMMSVACRQGSARSVSMMMDHTSDEVWSKDFVGFNCLDLAMMDETGEFQEKCAILLGKGCRFVSRLNAAQTKKINSVVATMNEERRLNKRKAEQDLEKNERNVECVMEALGYFTRAGGVPLFGADSSLNDIPEMVGDGIGDTDPRSSSRKRVRPM